MLLAVYRAVFVPALLIASAGLLVAGILGVASITPLNESSVLAAAVWMVAVGMVAFLLARPQAPTRPSSLIALTVGMLAASGAWGWARASVAGAFLALAWLVLFLLTVMATAARAERTSHAPRPPIC